MVQVRLILCSSPVIVNELSSLTKFPVDKFRNLAELLANLFPTVSDAPIRLSGKALDHTFLRPAETVENICKFYVNETMKQIYKIVGSLDFVGNPTMFVTSFYSGMRDFLLVPSVAFMSSPTDPSRVGLGVATGAMSLFFHSLSGFFGVVANLSAAAGHGVAYLSLDTDFREWHRDKVVIETTNLNREWKRRGVQHVGRMLTTPIMDILLGVTGGISGLVISPLKGYRKKGNLGMAGGVLVGGVGFFAKPSTYGLTGMRVQWTFILFETNVLLLKAVGILDAVTHFTASIHDIAKSVNVLDRRLQPVSKVRLPYTFGMSTILAPYDATIARAAYLLKRFSRHETRRGVDGSGETIVHVEVLPSMGNEAFVIVTTFRTILVRVKNGATSMMAPTLCWEVEFSKSVFVSSRVEDYGHNSVALIVLKHRNCTMAEEQEKDGGSLPALSPLPSAKSLVSIPDENLQARTSHLEDFDQSNSRATDGDLLDWYSILAEYQYRRQLTRLHNVISCISGDFASVVFDPSLTRPGSNEGYTSFGMFHFEKNEAQRSEFSNRLPIYAESLPWVNMVAFRESMAKAQNETVCMERLREQHSLLEEMEASRKEGGPDWLIVARATVLFENNNVPSSSLLLSDRNSEPSLLKGSLITRKVSFVEAEGQGQSTDDTLSSSFRPYYSARFNLTGSMVTDDALLFEESSQKSPLRRDDNDNNIGVNLQSHDESLPFHHRFIRSSSDSRISGAGDGALVPSDEMSRFDESRPNDQPFPMRRHSCLTLSPSSFSDEFFDASQSSALTYPFESIAKEKASVDRENEPGARIETEITMTGNNPDMIAESQPKPLKTERMTEMAATDSSENQEVLRPSSRSTAPADRMDRMETLLERLLIFSSEQALMHNDLQPRQRDAATNPYGGGAAADTTAASNTRSDTDDLRREIRELRDMMARLALQQQQQQELQQHVRQDASTMEDEEEDVVDVDDVNLRLELSVLRQEVASLRQHQQQSKKRKNIFGNGAAMALASTRSSARSGQQKEQQQNSPQKPNVGIEQID